MVGFLGNDSNFKLSYIKYFKYGVILLWYGHTRLYAEVSRLSR
jgi:hypothetical protein